jgi:hypothetical protein
VRSREERVKGEGRAERKGGGRRRGDVKGK